MPNWIAKNQLRFRSRQFPGVILMTSLMIANASIGLAQSADLTPAIPPPTTAETQPSNSKSILSNGVYFADIVVRGQPVFQVGSLSDLSASLRAQILNRRIASVLAQSEAGGKITVEPDRKRGIAILKLNNRVLMTVTQHDTGKWIITLKSL